MKNFKKKFNILKRCIRYARKLNHIEHLLNKYDKKNASIDCKELIKEIDLIL